MGNIFSAFRLKKPTVERLQTLKRAFELTYVQPLSNDYFIEKMMACVMEQDNKVWRTYLELTAVQEHAASNLESED